MYLLEGGFEDFPRHVSLGTGTNHVPRRPLDQVDDFPDEPFTHLDNAFPNLKIIEKLVISRIRWQSTTIVYRINELDEGNLVRVLPCPQVELWKSR